MQHTLVPFATVALLLPAGAWLFSACSSVNSPPPVSAAGEPKTARTTALEKGAEAVQQMEPVDAISYYLHGFHPMKEKPDQQVDAHHFCNQVNEDFAQCIIFDGNTRQANMVGVEYIISAEMFDKLPEAERALWHPHNYEILSGLLVAPGLPDVAEKEFMRTKMNSYGKTWHLWDTGTLLGQAKDDLPLDEPMLAWSFNADNELPPATLAARDVRLNVDTAKKRQQRQDLAVLARPQEGVDELARDFPERRPIRGVRDTEGPAMGR